MSAMSYGSSKAKEFAHLSEQLGADARASIEQTFHKLSERLRERKLRNAAQQEATEALLRVALLAEQQRTVRKTAHALLQAMKDRRGSELLSSRLLAPAARAQTLRPAHVEDLNVELAADTALQVYGPPYADQWVASATSQANAAAGTFGFLDGTTDGWVSSGAGVWVQFVPDSPLPRQVEVRAFTPYNYQWDDLSDNGYTTQNNAGFGIYVLSWNFQGADQRLELDYRYPIWSDSTGWWEEHHNPSWDGYDYDYAFLYGNEAPYFQAQPGRIYRACVWCFGSCDAGSGFFGNAIAAADINASVPFVVIGEQPPG